MIKIATISCSLLSKSLNHFPSGVEKGVLTDGSCSVMIGAAKEATGSEVVAAEPATKPPVVNKSRLNVTYWLTPSMPSYVG